MTTKCTLKPTVRETGAYVRERGMRPLGAAYSMAVKQRVYREQSEKRAARKARRAA